MRSCRSDDHSSTHSTISLAHFFGSPTIYFFDKQDTQIYPKAAFGGIITLFYNWIWMGVDHWLTTLHSIDDALPFSVSKARSWCRGSWVWAYLFLRPGKWHRISVFHHQTCIKLPFKRAPLLDKPHKYICQLHTANTYMTWHAMPVHSIPHACNTDRDLVGVLLFPHWMMILIAWLLFWGTDIWSNQECFRSYGYSLSVTRIVV